MTDEVPVVLPGQEAFDFGHPPAPMPVCRVDIAWDENGWSWHCTRHGDQRVTYPDLPAAQEAADAHVQGGAR